MDTPGRPLMPRQLGLGNNCLAQEKKKRNVKNCHLFAFPRYGYPLQSNCNRRMPVPLQKSVQANGSPHRGFFLFGGGYRVLNSLSWSERNAAIRHCNFLENGTISRKAVSG